MAGGRDIGEPLAPDAHGNVAAEGNQSKLPPGPYAIEFSSALSNNGKGHTYLVDGAGRKIAALWGQQDEKEALAELIIAARERVKP